MQKHKITEKEYEEVLKLLKLNSHKRIDKRLQVIKMRCEGKKDIEIATET